jgi:hypothetical protein
MVLIMTVPIGCTQSGPQGPNATQTDAQGSSQIESNGNAITNRYSIDYASFISAMREKGYSLEELQPQTSPDEHRLFSVPAKYIKVNGENISIFEFIDSDTANSQSQTISNDGSIIGGGIIEWIAPPHFYLQGRIIVGYIGRNQALLGNLAKILGNPITSI